MPRRTAPKCQRRSHANDRNDPFFSEHMDSLRTGAPILRAYDGCLLDNPHDYRRMWLEHGPEIMAEWADRLPGSRPMALYLLGEVRPPALQRVNHHFRSPVRFGNDVVIHDRAWHMTGLEFGHLVSIGVVTGAEKKRGIDLWGDPKEAWSEGYNQVGHPDSAKCTTLYFEAIGAAG